MRVVADISDASTRRDILAHMGEPTPDHACPRSATWEQAGAEDNPSPDAALPPAPAYEFDQHLNW
jgi:hypothetical protein